MHTRKAGRLPAGLESARRRFEHWRATRRRQGRIPESLWTAAVKLAQAHGVHRTARALSLGFDALKRRVEEQGAADKGSASAANRTTFVELTAPRSLPAASGECLLELEKADGVKMRIHLKGVNTPDLTALSRSLWGVEG